MASSSKNQGSSDEKGEEWVRLVSTDGYSFLVKRKVAMVSGTLKNMLGSESEKLKAIERLVNDCD